MVPDFALRLQSMMRALQEVILPALPKDQQLAQDQAKILLGNLRIMATQQDRVFQYLLVELREYAGLLRKLSLEATGGAATDAAAARARAALDRAEPITTLPIPSQTEVSDLLKSLKQAADELVHAAHEDGSGGFRQFLTAAVMQQSAAQILRERVWFSAAGFELDAGMLPSLDVVLE
jgi:hypothetical protein